MAFKMLMAFAYLGAVLISANGTAEQDTTVVFKTTVSCPLHQKWCLRIRYFENDLITVNDLIGETKYICTEEKEYVSVIEIGLKPMEIFRSPISYSALFNHNCTSDHMYRKLFKSIGEAQDENSVHENSFVLGSEGQAIGNNDESIRNGKSYNDN